MSRSRIVASFGLLVFIVAGGMAAEPVPEAPAARADRYGDGLPAGAVARLGTARFRDGRYTNGAALSPDGKIWAASSNRGNVRLWDVASGKEIRRIQSDNLGVNVLAFSPDSKRLAGSGFGRGIIVWEVSTGKELAKLDQQRSTRPTQLAFSGDGKFIAAAGENYGTESPAHVWEVAPARQFGPFNIPKEVINQVALSADGKMLLTGSHINDRTGLRRQPQTGTVHLWDVAGGKDLRTIKAEGGLVGAAAFTPDGKSVAFAEGQDTIGLWDVESGEHRRHFSGRSGVGNALAFAPDGKVLAAVTPTGATHFWDVASGKRLGIHDGPSCQGRGLAFAGGKVLAWGLDGQALRLWDAKSGAALAPADGHNGPIASIAFLRDGKYLASTVGGGRSQGGDGKVFVWDLATSREVRRIEAKGDERYPIGFRGSAGVAFCPATNRTAIAVEYTGVRLIDLASAKEICTVQAQLHSYETNVMRFSPDGKLLALSGDRQGQGVLSLWSTESGLKVRDLKAGVVNPRSFGRGRCAAFSPDGKLLAESTEISGNRGEDTGSTRIWDATSGKEIRTLLSGSATSVAFSADGMLASGGRGSVKLWDVNTGRELGELARSNNIRTSPLVFSPDGRLLAFGVSASDGAQASVEVWEVASRTLREELKGHAGAVTALAFSGDGKTLATGGADTTILLWDLHANAGAAPARLAAADLDTIWSDLASSSARDALPSLRKLAATPADALPYLKKHLKPVAGEVPDAERIAKLVTQLDDDTFTVREQATRELGQVGKPAEAALRKALADKASPEVRRRAEQLLDKLAQPGTPLDMVRPLRALEAVERMGTPEARELLKALAGGKADATLTRQAKAALDRLETK